MRINRGDDAAFGFCVGGREDGDGGTFGRGAFAGEGANGGELGGAGGMGLRVVELDVHSGGVFDCVFGC